MSRGRPRRKCDRHLKTLKRAPPPPHSAILFGGEFSPRQNRPQKRSRSVWAGESLRR
ncbi:hypothetical protein [Limnospira platensis]|uniref:hypothetical protein n=1 Tax=Limnospira platensis TaxID=118562 RepID=UPI0021AAACCE